MPSPSVDAKVIAQAIDNLNKEFVRFGKVMDHNTKLLIEINTKLSEGEKDGN